MGAYALNGLTVVALLLGFTLLGAWVERLRTKRKWQRALAASQQQITSYQQQVADLQQQSQDSQEESKQLSNTLADQAAETRAKAQEVVALQDQLSTAAQQLEQALAEQAQVLVLQQQLTDITNQLKTQEERAVQQQEKQRVLQQKHNTLQQQLANKEKEVAALQTAAETHAQDKQSLETQLAELEKEVAQQVALLAGVSLTYQAEVALRLDVTNQIEQIYNRLREAPQDEETNHVADPTPPDALMVDPSPVPQTNDTPSQEVSFQVPSKIEMFLQNRNIQVRNVPAEDTADPILNGLALQLGDHYEVLKVVYQRIKRNMQKGGSFDLHLKEEPPQTISRISQFCKNLHEIAFLEQYRYLRSPHYLLKVKTTTMSKAQNFFSGLWLERYLVQKIQQIVTTISQELQCELVFAYLNNPRITLPTGVNSELDLIFHINETFYWIEAKTGDYQQHISKYSKISRVMGLDEKHAMIILPDIQGAHSEKLTTLFHMSVYSLADFELHLTNTIKGDLLAASPPRKEGVSSSI